MIDVKAMTGAELLQLRKSLRWSQDLEDMETVARIELELASRPPCNEVRERVGSFGRQRLKGVHR